MTPERWSEVKALFDQLIALPEGDQRARLDQLEDREIASEVESLLGFHNLPDSALDHPPAAVEQWRDSETPILHFAKGDLIANRFEIVGFVGEGGMGEVYEAFDRELQLRVALKTLKSSLSVSEKLIERFKQEIQNARAVSHPNVCRVFDVGRHKTGPTELLFCTMEFIDGEPLSHWIKREGALPVAKALPIATACAAALDAAHRAGVVHCDFKSANVLIGTAPNGQKTVHVTDFGLSRFWSSTPTEHQQTTGSLAIGTPAYMAPEQLQGESPTPLSDIYAFGVVLYELVTGRSPYDSSSPIAMVARKVSQPPAAPSTITHGLPVAWEESILRCLAIRPQDRFAAASDAIAAIERTYSRRKLLLYPAAASLAAASGYWFYRQFSYADDPTSTSLLQGRLALAENAPWRAAFLFEQASADHPRSALARAHWAIALAQLDRLDEAKDKLLSLDRDSNLAPRVDHYVRASRAIVLRDLPTALTHIDALLPGAKDTERLALLLEKAQTLPTPAALKLLESAATEFAHEPSLSLQRGILLMRAAKDDDALAQLTIAETGFRNRNSPEGAAEALLQKAKIAQRNKSLDQAAAIFDQALAFARSTGNIPQQIRLEGARAGLLIVAGKRAEAEAISTSTIQLAHRNNLTNLAARSENDLASSCLAQYKLEDAEKHFRNAIQLAQPARARQEEARAHLNLASTYTRHRQGRMREALAEIDLSLPFYEQGGYQQQLTSGLTIKAHALMNLARHRQAQAVFEQIVATKDPELSPKAKEWLADIAAWRGDFATALSGKQQLFEFYTELKRVPAAFYMLMHRASILTEASRFPLAAAAITQASSLLKTLDSGNTAMYDSSIQVEARLNSAQGRYGDSIQPLRKIVGSPTVRDSLRRYQIESQLGELEARSGDIAQGLKRCQRIWEEAKSLEVIEIRTEAAARLAIAAYLGKQNEPSLAAATIAYQLSAEHGFRFWQLVSLTLLNRLQPQSRWSEERNKLLQNYGQDELGPLGPRLVTRPDFQQIS